MYGCVGGLGGQPPSPTRPGAGWHCQVTCTVDCDPCAQWACRLRLGPRDRLADRRLLLRREAPPGSPWQNGFAESFFSRLRDELLNVEEFMNLAEAQWFARIHRQAHNQERPHSSLGYQTPSEFAAGCAASSATAASSPRPSQQRLPGRKTPENSPRVRQRALLRCGAKLARSGSRLDPNGKSRHRE
jgi:hypothetical protein